MDDAARSQRLGKITTFSCWLALFGLFGFRTTFAVLKNPMAADLAWSGADVSLGYSILMLVYAITAFFSGPMIDKWGTRPTFAIAAVFGFLGFFLTAKIDTVLAYYFTFGVIGGVSNGMCWVSSTVSIRKWYVGAGYGKMFGWAFMGAPVAQIIMSTMVKSQLAGGDPTAWRGAMHSLSFLTLAVLALAAIVARKTPEQYGLKPNGLPPAPAPGAPAAAAPPAEYRWTRGEAFRTYPVWAAILVFLTAMIGEFLIWSQIVSYWVLDLKMPLADATDMYILIGIFGIFTMVLVGMGTDAIVRKVGHEPTGRRLVLIIGPLIGFIACVLLLMQPQNVMFGYASTVIFAIYWAIVPGGVVGYAGSIYGRLTLGTIWGLATLIIMGIGPFTGSFVGATLADHFGSYRYSIMFAAGAFVVASIFAFTMPTSIKTPDQK